MPSAQLAKQSGRLARAGKGADWLDARNVQISPLSVRLSRINSSSLFTPIISCRRLTHITPLTTTHSLISRHLSYSTRKQNMAPNQEGKMQYRFLGRSGLQVSAISLGGWVTYGGHVDSEATFKCMEVAWKHGINFFDCAEAYSGGESEKVMGQAVKKFGWKRSDLVISTKLYWGSAYGENPVNNKGLSRKHIIEGMNMALERLDMDYVDLIYAHRPDRLTPMEETVRAFNHLIDQGKAFYWGTSEWNPEEIADAWRHADRLGLIGPVMEQPQYSMLARDRVEKDYMLLYENQGLGLTTWSPLRYGILTGKYDEGIPEDSRFATAKDNVSKHMAETYGNEDWRKQLETVKKLKPVAEKLDCSRANLALAWVLKNKRVSSAIIGASRPEQIDENMKAFDIVEKLTPEIMEEIEDILANKPAKLTDRF